MRRFGSALSRRDEGEGANRYIEGPIAEPRDVDVAAVQAQLTRQGAVVERPKRDAEPARAGANLDGEFAESIHRKFEGDMGAA